MGGVRRFSKYIVDVVCSEILKLGIEQIISPPTQKDEMEAGFTHDGYDHQYTIVTS